MVFSSIPFLYYFLPISLGGYFLMPGKAKNGWLLACSLVFYGWGEPKLLWLMVSTILLFLGTPPGHRLGPHLHGHCAEENVAQFQRLFSDINLHVMSLRFGDFRVGTTDFVFVTWIHSRCEEATTRFEAQDG